MGKKENLQKSEYELKNRESIRIYLLEERREK